MKSDRRGNLGSDLLNLEQVLSTHAHSCLLLQKMHLKELELRGRDGEVSLQTVPQGGGHEICLHIPLAIMYTTRNVPKPTCKIDSLDFSS